MGISFGVRLLLALLLRPILLFADNNYCHAIVDASITLPLPRTKATANDVSDTVAVRRGGRLDRALAGGTSRALAQAALYPLDALRTLAQTRDGRTLADVGARTLLNGCFQTSTVALLTGAAQFGLRGLFEPHFGPLASSALGAAGSCVFSVPQEVVKQRLVTGVYGSFRYAVSEIWRTEGAAGFYAGWRPTMSRNVPFVVATFASRDALQGAIAGYRRRRSGRDDVGDVTKTAVAEDVVVGIASALVACALTQPMDVVKTRMMTQAASMAVPYASALDCATSILRTEGWRRLYSGVGQRAVYMGGMWGVTFGLEPVLTKYLAEREARRHYLAASIEAPGPERKWGKVVAPRDCCRGRTSTTATATSRRRRIRSRRRRRRRRRP
jgi:solute carrier family 25 S-adenosylmethionine transporter 26